MHENIILFVMIIYGIYITLIEIQRLVDTD
jgi:hypothetical protein